MKLNNKLFGLALIIVAAQSLGSAGTADANANAVPLATLNAPEKANRALLNLRLNETTDVLGIRFYSKSDSQVLKVISSEYVTLAILQGELEFETTSAKAGEAIVIPISRNRFEVLEFDAARLLATMEPAWIAQARQNLVAIEKAQRRKLFWGLLEQTGVNASAPLPVQIERVRQSYLSQPAIIDIRHRARGNEVLLQTLTVQKFKEAIAASDVDTVAALIDPYPFTDVSENPNVWHLARRNFAATLAQDSNLKSALSQSRIEREPTTGQFYIGAANSMFVITLVRRDSAAFVAAVELVR